jgi:hypothetical protein
VASVIAAVAGLNAIFLATGYCLLAPALRGLRPLVWTTFAGIALLVGAASIGVVLCVSAVLGQRTGLPMLTAVAALLAGAGILAAMLVPARHLRRIRFQMVAPAPQSPVAATLGTAAATFVTSMCAVTVVAAFRSSPWLDDAYTFWLPKGLLLGSLGLDARLFAQTDRYIGFVSPDYPLWWSVIGGLEMDFVRSVDLRAVNAQVAILLAALVASVARLLWGRVRPWILWTGLAVLVASAELLRQTQSGGADVPLAVFLSLTVLAAVLWLASGQWFFVGLAGVSAAAAASVKVEGTAQLVVLVALPAILVAPIVLRRGLVLIAALLAAWATSVPWLVWQAAHDVPSEFDLSSAFDPVYLADRVERVVPSAKAVALSLVGREWPLIVPVFAVLTIAGLVLERRAVWLVPAGVFAACFALWVWTYWAGSVELDFWLTTSAYRVVDSLLLATAVIIPLMAERLVRVCEARRDPTRLSSPEW